MASKPTTYEFSFDFWSSKMKYLLDISGNMWNLSDS